MRKNLIFISAFLALVVSYEFLAIGNKTLPSFTKKFFVKTKPVEKINVVVSAKPLHSVVCHLLEDIATVDILLDGPFCPHSTQLKPSKYQLLKQSEFIIWSGESAEPQIFKVLKPYWHKAINLESDPNFTLKKKRSGYFFGAQNPNAYDSHYWLDPRTMIKAVVIISEELRQKIDKKYHETLAKNTLETVKYLQDIYDHGKGFFSSLQGEQYLTYHDSYLYFDDAFGTQCIGVIKFDQSGSLYMKHLLAIQDAINRKNIQPRCLIISPKYSGTLTQNIAQRLGLSTCTVDDVGANILTGKDYYKLLIQKVTFEMSRALGNNGSD